MNELAVKGSNFTIRETGIEFQGELTREEWNDLGCRIARVAKSIGFIVGDWINYGEKRWGEMYADAIQRTGLDYQTLRDYAYTARRVELSLRNDKLDFSHHRAVAKLEPAEQRRWLEASERHDLSVRRLRVSMNKGRVAGLDELDVEPADRGQHTYMTWLNKLLHWWTRRTEAEPVEQWDEQDRQRLKRDLEPWVKIYNQL
jgi:hypothetical protein